jgi:hypothetical protein
MIYNLSTILNNTMKNTRKSNIIYLPNTLSQNTLSQNNKINTHNLKIDIELANKKSLELYEKYNSKPKFSILDGNKNQDINKNINKIINKNGLYIFGYFCIFLASFHYFDLKKIICPFPFSFRLV